MNWLEKLLTINGAEFYYKRCKIFPRMLQNVLQFKNNLYNSTLIKTDYARPCF